MQITTITVSKKKNCGNYETADLSMTAELNEKDNPDKVGEDLAFYIDYKLNQTDREHKLSEIKAEVASGTSKGRELPEEGIKQREGWIAKYNQTAERFNSLEFIK